MPGTMWRACSCRTKVFHAAMNGRGRAVIITVSSMSLTRPNVTSVPITCTLPRTGSAPSASMVTSCQPGSRPGERTSTST